MYFGQLPKQWSHSLTMRGRHCPWQGTQRSRLPVIPELLEELSCSWADCLYSSTSPVSRPSALDCEAIEKLGLLHFPPHPSKSTVMFSRSPSFASELECVQQLCQPGHSTCSRSSHPTKLCWVRTHVSIRRRCGTQLPSLLIYASAFSAVGPRYR